MKKSEFQVMINEAVASAVKRLFIDTNFLDALLEDAERRFATTLKEAMASSSMMMAAAASKKKCADEVDFNFDEDEGEDENEEVDYNKSRLENAAETLLERKGREIRRSLGGFNPFSESTIDNALRMQEGESKVQVSDSSAPTSLSDQPSDPTLPVVTKDFIRALAGDAGFKKVVEKIKPTEGRDGPVQVELNEEEIPQKKRGRPAKVIVTDYYSVADKIAQDALGDFDA